MRLGYGKLRADETGWLILFKEGVIIIICSKEHDWVQPNTFSIQVPLLGSQPQRTRRQPGIGLDQMETAQPRGSRPRSQTRVLNNSHFEAGYCLRSLFHTYTQTNWYRYIFIDQSPPHRPCSHQASPPPRGKQGLSSCLASVKELPPSQAWATYEVGEWGKRDLPPEIEEMSQCLASRSV